MPVTRAQLEQRVKHLNTVTDSPECDYVKQTEDGTVRYVPQHGHYYVQAAYGGYRLERINGRGAEDISPRGTKAEVFNFIGAWLAGYFERDRQTKRRISDNLHPKTEFDLTKHSSVAGGHPA